MIVATRYGNRHVRSFGPNTALAPPPWAGRVAASGEPVTQDNALGLPPIGRAVRLVCGTVASLPLRVYQGVGGDKRELPDSPQGRLLRNPVAGMSLYDWKWDVAAALEVNENAFLLKVRDGNGRVLELLPVPPEFVYGFVRGGDKVFQVWTPDGRQELSALEILHVRGQTMKGGPFGVPRVHQHNDPVGSMLAATRFEGSYFRNHARPDVAIVFPQGVTQKQATEWREVWESEYGGPGNAGRALPLGGGAQVVPIPVSMRDSQHIEGRQFNVEDAGRIMDVDPALLGAPEDGDVRATALELFLKLQLPPRLRRIEGALLADMDLFQLGTDMYPRFEVDDLMFSDPLTRAQVQHFRVQDGTELVDEARADNGRPPLPDGQGQIPQITPVGGAPNPAPDDDFERALRLRREIAAERARLKIA